MKNFSQLSIRYLIGAAASGPHGLQAASQALQDAALLGGSTSDAAALALATAFVNNLEASAMGQAIALAIQQQGCPIMHPVLAQVLLSPRQHHSQIPIDSAMYLS